jgi:hypothetical protein
LAGDTAAAIEAEPFEEAGLAPTLVGGVWLGARLRPIGRGLGKGTCGLAAAIDDTAMANDKPVARAVDRNAVARTNGFTKFLRGESSSLDA